MTTINATHPTAGTYVAALVQVRDFPAPFDAVLMTMLTGLLQFHELVAPPTYVDGTHLRVQGTRRQLRTMPASTALTATLRRAGSVSKILAVAGVSAPALKGMLATQLLDHEGLAGAMTVEDVWALAISGLTRAAVSPTTRRAIRAYVGHGTASDADLRSVAELIDECCRRGGYAVA